VAELREAVGSTPDDDHALAALAEACEAAGDLSQGIEAAAQAARLLAEEPLQTHRTLASAERTGLAHPRGIPASNVAPRYAPARPSPAQPTRRRHDRERDA